MGFSAAWDDKDTQTVMRFRAEGVWNWNDYHKAVRMAMFTLHKHDKPVDVIVDLSGTDHLPGGALAHVRSFGKRLNPNMTGRAVVIDLDADTERALLAGNDARLLRHGEQTIYFVDSDAEARALLNVLQAE